MSRCCVYRLALSVVVCLSVMSPGRHLVLSIDQQPIEMASVEEYLNTCMDGKNHKSEPGPEATLVRELCSPWTDRSCCTAHTAMGIHLSPAWLGFDWNHCGELSPRCREYFLMDLCFYECEPNVGPWLVQDKRKIRNERFLNVPLCPSVCGAWWDACKDDLTCKEDWSQGFNWTTGTNRCPLGSQCKPFRDIYTGGATHFCEKVMGGSFKVTGSEADCMVLWPDKHFPNPNEEVARKRAAQKLGVPYVPAEARRSHNSQSQAGNGGVRGSGGVGGSAAVVLFVSVVVAAFLCAFQV